MASNPPPTSEPATPSKSKTTQQVEKGATRTPSRARSSSSSGTHPGSRPSDFTTPSKNHTPKAEVEQTPRFASMEVQVPCTLPHGQEVGHQDTERSDGSDVASDVALEGGEMEQGAEQQEGKESDPKAALEPYDWDEFERRCESELLEARNKEIALSRETDVLFRVGDILVRFDFGS
ncbi:hypothetical protein PVAG01_06337 [Phlyctema vagabunda]|uniref:Uncharacterized protein n=1 Tax=Phlyctema vagabunda TaxID=108571 RepID=A0ABR4PGQ2_9HELO